MVWCVASGVAAAEEGDKELARQRYKTGQALFQRGKVVEALHEFEQGKESFLLPEFDYNIGLCLAKLGRPADAADALQRYIDARSDDADAAGIWKMIAELRAEAAAQKKAAEEARPPPPSPAPLLVAPPLPPTPRADGRRAVFTKAAVATAALGRAMLLTGVITGGAALGIRGD